jgi:hypothetical protein
MRKRNTSGMGHLQELFFPDGSNGLGMLCLDLIERQAFLEQVRGMVLSTKVAVLIALPCFGG